MATKRRNVDKVVKPRAESDPASYDNGELLSLWPDGFAGISTKGLFKVLPSWVDEKKAPGTSSQLEQLGLSMTVREILLIPCSRFSRIRGTCADQQM